MTGNATHGVLRELLILRTVVALVLLMTALLTAGCATSAVCARKPPYRQMRGAVKEIALHANAGSNQWMALVTCDKRTPVGIQAMTTNGCLVLAADKGNSIIVRRVVEAMRGQPLAAGISFITSRPDLCSMTVGGHMTGWDSLHYEHINWALVGTDPSTIGGEIVCTIPDANITYTYKPPSSRPIFYAEQVVLFPLALCADVVTFPFQVVLIAIGGSIHAAMWP